MGLVPTSQVNIYDVMYSGPYDGLHSVHKALEHDASSVTLLIKFHVNDSRVILAYVNAPH